MASSVTKLLLSHHSTKVLHLLSYMTLVDAYCGATTLSLTSMEKPDAFKALFERPKREGLGTLDSDETCWIVAVSTLSCTLAT